jgi:GTP-binding protein EngB required for normal cell division
VLSKRGEPDRIRARSVAMFAAPYHKGLISKRLSEPAGSSVFPDNHQRYLFSRLRHIDEILGDAVQALEFTDETRLFRRVIRDATPAQRKVLQDYLAHLRFALKRFIEAQQLQDASHTVSGLWSLRTAVIFAQTAVTELRPVYMSGYGPLDEDAIQASESLVAELTTLLHRLGNYLDKGEQGDLAARLAHLDGTQDEIALLRELERIVTAHGFVELRAPLESLVERATAPRYEIAVLGRVNSGKSSLLNWWLGQDVLPTGVTPVTAVPTRVLQGARPRVRAKVAGSPWREIPVGELSDYVTEAGNPGNAKRVIEMVLEIPAERLNEGVCLVDTPGIGSLAAAGAALTLEYLPRCDLGIQLVEAGGVLALEDLAIARALLDGGSDLLIVLSKADRLTAPELSESVAYVRATISRELGVAVSVSPVSTLPSHAALTAQWFDQELRPRLSSHREQSTRLLRRKIGALRESVTAVLASRLEGGGERRSRGAETAEEPLQAMLAGLRAELEKIRSDLLARAAHVHECVEWLLSGATEELVRVWLARTDPAAQLPERLRDSIARRAAEIGDIIAQGLKDGRDQLQQRLARELPAALCELPYPRGRPVYDSDSLPTLTRYERPRWGFVRALLLSSARARVATALLPALSERLSLHGEALRLWGLRYVEELAASIDEAVAVKEAGDRSRAGAPAAAAALNDLQRDLNLLQHWSAERRANSALYQGERSETQKRHDH